MFVDNQPMTVDSAKTHGEPKVEWDNLSVGFDVAAVPDRGQKSDFETGNDLNLVEVECYRFRSKSIKDLPSLHVGFDALGEKGRGDVEHEDVRMMACANRFEVFLAYGFGPTIEYSAKFQFICSHVLQQILC